MQVNMDQFRDAFFEEAAEHLANMESGLLQLESSPHDLELMHAIFRGAHSIKGGSGMFGFADITRFTHAMESLLDLMRDEKIAVTPTLTDLLLRSTDILRTLVTIAKEGGELPATLEGTLQELHHALSQDEAPVSLTVEVVSAPSESDLTLLGYRIYFQPGPDLFRQGQDPLLVLRELDQFGEVTELQADLSHLPDLTHLDPESCYLAWSLVVKTDKNEAELRSIFSFVEDSSEIRIEALFSSAPQTLGGETTPASPSELTPGLPTPEAHVVAPKSPAATAKPPAANAESASIRVSTEKVDKLINLVGELVITQSMISQTIQEFSPEKLSQLRESIIEMERNTRELQERVMAVRMLPIGNVFSRYPRLVRDLAATLNKKIAVQMFGEETELDKSVIERIGDPLTHLVRNAADHGLETPEERQQAGKSEQGVIRLQAFHQGGNVIIEVADDGRGLNTDRIRQKAIAQGLIGAEDNLNEEQIHALIFHPGFSTAAVVSDVSGRGVGMDVVKKNIESLNGTVSINSEAGRGSRIRIKLPLTLAIIDGLSLSVGDEIYILPLTAIIESIRPRPEQVKRVMGQGEVVVVRGEFLPLLRLHALFDVPARVTDPSRGLVVIVENEGRRFGLLVDELLGQSQVVIKNLEANYRKVEGAIGATIMGDGRVALILDVLGLSRLAAFGGGWHPVSLEEAGSGINAEAALQQMDAEMCSA